SAFNHLLSQRCTIFIPQILLKSCRNIKSRRSGIDSLQFHNVGCLQASLTVDQIEFNGVAFVKGLEAFALDGGVMDKYVVAILALDEPITLFLIKPLDFSLH